MTCCNVLVREHLCLGHVLSLGTSACTTDSLHWDFLQHHCELRIFAKILQLLEDFIASLQPWRSFTSYARSSSTLALRAKVQQHRAEDNVSDHTSSQALQPAIGEFDGLAAALGFFGSDVTSLQDFGVESTHGRNDNDATPAFNPSLQSGNISIYGLLELDLNEIAHL